MRLQVLIPEQLNSRIRKAAARSRLPVGAWVRRTIEDALQRPGQAADPLARLASLDAPTADIEQMIAEIEAGRR